MTFITDLIHSDMSRNVALNGCGLANNIMERLYELYTEIGLNPGSEVIANQMEAALTVAAMAEGHAEDKIFLSSLDPGMGKTLFLCCAIQSLLACESYNDIGVLVLVGRLEEVRSIVDRLNMAADALGSVPINRIPF